MELSSKILEQIAYNTRAKIQENILVYMNKSTHEEHLSQPFQTNNKQFKIAVTFLTGYNGIFNISNKNNNNKFYFKKSITNSDDFIKITIPPGAYEIKSLDQEIKRIIIDQGYYTEEDYPFKIKANFSTLGIILEISPQGPIISFASDDTLGDLLGFRETLLYQEHNLSLNPVDILSFDNIFLECDFAQGMLFKGRRSGIIHNFTMDVDTGYKYIEKFRGNVQWYMMHSKDSISSICFELKNEN